jgi:hypothetical protein
MVDFTEFRSANLETLAPANWDRFVGAIEAELNGLGESVSSQEAVSQTVLLRGLQIIDDNLTPIITGAQTSVDGAVSSAESAITSQEASAQASITSITAAATAAATELQNSVSNLGALLTGTSSSTVTVAAGNLTFVLDEGSRPVFLASLFLAAVVSTDPNTWVAGELVSYDSTTGILVIDVTATRGSGSHSSWKIGITAVPQLADLSTLTQLQVATDFSSSFNGTTAAFALTDSGAAPILPQSAACCIVSLGGILQKPGTDFTISSSNITFTTPPEAGVECFVIVVTVGDASAINADWDAVSGAALILNKPTIPAAQVNSDWNATSGLAEIYNKPSIPAAQVPSDWNAASGVAAILNKPTLPVTMTGASSGASGTVGLVPAPPSGAQGKFLRGDATWDALAAVAISGSYTDLSNTPEIPAGQVNSDWNASSGLSQILNKPSLATVATSGSYNDLSNKPSIPAAQVQSDWNATSGVTEILNKPTIPSAPSVMTGATSSVSGTSGLVPEPTAGQEALFLRGDGEWAAPSSGGGGSSPTNLTLSESSTTVSIASSTGTGVTIPAATDTVAGVLDAARATKIDGLATVATSGAYGDLTGKPSIPGAMSGATSGASGSAGTVPAPTAGQQGDVLFGSGSWAQITASNVGGLATVATSGAYSDLTGRPTLGSLASLSALPVPAASVLGGVFAEAASAHHFVTGVSTTGDLTFAQPSASDISGLATVASTGAYSDLSGKPSLGSLAALSALPVPQASVLGGVFSASAPSNQFMTGVNGSGAPVFAQPSVSNISGLAAVAASGSYNDLSNKPSIPNPVSAKLPVSFASGFNGTQTVFALQDGTGTAISPGSVGLCFVVLGGVLQNPGVDFTISGNNLTFTTAPATGTSCFAIVLGN